MQRTVYQSMAPKGFVRATAKRPIPARKLDIKAKVINIRPPTQSQTKESLIGNQHQWNEVITWLKNTKEQNCLTIVGPPGIGKTSGVHIHCREANITTMESHASDIITSEQMRNDIYELCTRKSFAGPIVVLLDDMDASPIYVVKELIKFLKSPPMPCAPIICTCNSISEQNIRDLKGVSKVVYMSPVPIETMVSFALKRWPYKNTQQVRIKAAESRGDVRQFLTKLQITEAGDTETSINPFKATHILLSGIAKTEHEVHAAMSAEEPNKMQHFLFENYTRALIHMDSVAQAAEIFSCTDTMRHGNVKQLHGEAQYLLAHCAVGMISQQNIVPPTAQGKNKFKPVEFSSLQQH